MAVELESTTNVQDLAAALLDAMNSQKEAQTPSVTLKEFATIYLERHSKAHNKTWKADESRLRLHILPAFANQPLTTITTAKIVEFQSLMIQKALNVGNNGTHQANRCIEQLGHMFRQARSWGYFPEERRLPTEGVKSFRELSRERFVDHDEIERLAIALNEVQSERMRVLLWLHLLTGMRTTELRHLKWCEVDESKQQLNKSGGDMKNWKPACQPLAAIAMELLSKLPKTGVYVFSEEGAAKPFNRSSVYKVFNRVRKRANLPDIRIHDLRRTVGSWLAQSGVPLPLIAKVLNHSDMRATEIYARFANADSRAALEAHAAALNQHIDISHLLESKPKKTKSSEKLTLTLIPIPSMPSIAQALKQVTAPHLHAFFWLYFLTGLSQKELLGAEWTDYDADEKTLLIPAAHSHSGKAIKQPLSALAAQKLEALPKHAPFIFCSPSWQTPVSDHCIRVSWDGVRRRAKLPHLDIRALKNTAAKLLIEADAPPDLIARIMNRKTLDVKALSPARPWDGKAPRIRQKNRNYSVDEIREALEQLASKVIMLAENSSVARLPVQPK